MGAAAAALLAGAAPAWAAERYASPGSGVDSGPCAQADPCTGSWAIMGASGSDDVVLAPGSYALDTSLKPHAGVTIHGADGQVPPLLVFGASVDGDGLTLTGGSSLRHADIQMLGAKGSALVLQGARGDDLLLYEGASGDARSDHPRAAASLVGADGDTVLADSVADATGGGTTAVTADGGSGGRRVVLANVTAVAQAPGSSAVAATMAKGALTLTDVIARGVAADIAGGGGSDESPPAQVSYSNFRPEQSSGFADGGHNQQAPPMFADPARGDFHELAGSPTIDAGTPVGDSGPVDPDGSPRMLGVAPDIGAYEYNASLVGPGVAPGFPGGGPAAGAPGVTGVGLSGAMFATGGQALPRPQAGKNFIARRLSGLVLVQFAGASSFVPLPDRALLPFGTKLDTRHGKVAITAARDMAGDLQVGRFFSGMFDTAQRKPSTARSRPTVLMTLIGNALAGCRRLPNGHQASAARSEAVAVAARRRRRRHRHRSLWAQDNGGNFSTHGENSVAAVRGTRWLTQDYCSGTLTRVVQGRVLLHDLVTGRRILLSAGEHYFADLRLAPPLRRHR